MLANAAVIVGYNNYFLYNTVGRAKRNIQLKLCS